MLIKLAGDNVDTLNSLYDIARNPRAFITAQLNTMKQRACTQNGASRCLQKIAEMPSYQPASGNPYFGRFTDTTFKEAVAIRKAAVEATKQHLRSAAPRSQR